MPSTRAEVEAETAELERMLTPHVTGATPADDELLRWMSWIHRQHPSSSSATIQNIQKNYQRRHSPSDRE